MTPVTRFVPPLAFFGSEKESRLQNSDLGGGFFCPRNARGAGGRLGDIRQG